MKIHLRIFVLSVGLLVSLYACGPVPTPHDYYVSTSGNDGNDCLTEANACLTLDRAIGLATPQSRVHIGPGTFPADVVVSKWMTIMGAGTDQTTLSAVAPSATILTIPNTVHLDASDLTLGGGNDAVTLVSNSIATQLTLKHVTITGAHVGVNSQMSAVFLIDDNFLNDDTGLTTNAGTLNISSTTFTGSANSAIVSSSVAVLDNITVDSNQGGITNNVNGSAVGRMQISNSAITNNQSSGINNLGQLNISGSRIENNLQDGIDTAGNLRIDTSIVRGNGHVGINTSGESTTPPVQVSRTAITDNGFSTEGNSLSPYHAGFEIYGGTATIVNSTISNNRDEGIYNEIGDLTLSFDTVAFNTGNGILIFTNASRDPSPTHVQSSIIALNTMTNCSLWSTTVDVDSYSLACDDSLMNPALGVDPLASDGTTWFNPLEATSQAIHRALGACPATDQRGLARLASGCDVGAYEFGAGSHLTAATPSTETPTLPVLQIVTNTPTPTPLAVPQLILTENANCRKGPGTAYDVVTSFVKNTTLDASGRNTDSSWWLAKIPGGGTCWVSNTAVGKNGPLDQLAIIQAPALPDAPAKLDNSHVCVTLKAQSLTVTLNWASVSGATGYTLYRNGTLLTTVGGGTTTYIDNAPMATDLTYAVEAVNANGHSGQATTTVPACK